LVAITPSGNADVELLPIKPQKDVRVIEGMLEDIILNSAKDKQADDYLMVRLLDKTAILDPINKLRAVYPNVLHLERTGLMQTNKDDIQLGSDQLKQSDMDMFSSFFEQVAGDSLNKEQRMAVERVIEELRKESSE